MICTRPLHNNLLSSSTGPEILAFLKKQREQKQASKPPIVGDKETKMDISEP